MMTTGDSNRKKRGKERKEGRGREGAREAATNLLSNLYSMLLGTAAVRQRLLHSFCGSRNRKTSAPSPASVELLFIKYKPYTRDVQAWICNHPQNYLPHADYHSFDQEELEFLKSDGS